MRNRTGVQENFAMVFYKCLNAYCGLTYCFVCFFMCGFLNELYSMLLALANCFRVLVYCTSLTLVSRGTYALLADDSPATAWTHISVSKTRAHAMC
jgi:hypothetical protein